MPGNYTDWRRFIKFGSNVSSSQRTSLTLFFDRVSSHAFGQEFLRRIAQNGTVTVNTSRTARSSYDPSSRTIDLGNSTFDNAGDGNYIITMLHELTHHAYRQHYIFALHNTVESFSRNLRDEARRQGLSEAQYNQIVAPLAQILNYEQAASINAAYLANQIFAYDVEASPYYILPLGSPENPDPDFDYTTPSLGVTSEEIAEFGIITQRVSRYSFATPMDTVNEAAEIFNRVIDRAVAVGLYSEQRGNQLKEFYRERSRVRIDFYSRRNQLLGFDQGDSPAVPLIVDKVDADGVPYGWDVYEVVDGEEKLVESYEVLYQRDEDGSLVLDEDGAAVKLGVRSIKNGLGVQRLVRPGTDEIIDTNIFIPGNPLGIEFSDLGAALGQQLGYRLAGDDVILSIGASAFLQTIGDNLGDVLDGLLFTANGESNGLSEVVSIAFESFPDELLANLKSAGVGALSSFLTAELVSVIGLDGFEGELANSAAGAVINRIVSNIAAGANFTKPSELFNGVNAGLLVTTVGSFLGNKLANEVHDWDTVGGQIGAAVGSAISVAFDAELVAALAATGQIELIAVAVVIVVIDAFIGNLIGGLIGSLFGGTPRSGADAVWSEREQKFVVANVYSKKGGSKDAARSLASAAAETFNAVLGATGGTLLNPQAMQSGNYGMRKKDYVYRPYSTRESDAITYRLSSNSEESFGRLVGYGVVQGLTDPDFQIAGGDTYIKRAIYNTFDIGGVDAKNFDTNVLLGNIASAQQYESYLANAGVINALVSAEPDSALAIETLIILARAEELGLTRRHRSDWFGGFTSLIKEAGTNAADVDFGLDYDPLSGQVSRLMWVGNYVLGDAIDIAGQTTIEATSAAQTIDLRSGSLADQRGYTVNGDLNNDIAASGSDFTANTAAISFASGDLRKSVSVTIANDGVVEATENFLGQISNGTDLAIVGSSADATIIDGTAATPTLIVGRSYAREGDGYATFRISLSKAASGAVSVSLSLADLTTTTGVDLGTTLQVSHDGVIWNDATSATFAAGQTELFVRAAVLSDNAANPDYVAGGDEPQTLGIEGNERFTLTATVTAGASLIANAADADGAVTASGTGTILDVTTGTLPLAWIDAVVVDEASGQAIFSIARSKSGTSGSLTFSTADSRVLNIEVAATVDAGGGDDVVHASNLGDNVFGGAGNDTLYGGRLDDWLLGGDGDDTLDAGSANAGTLGGDGNYLDGGAGDDQLFGREGSDWLEGGEGVDILRAGHGGDVLSGGATDGDQLFGGAGDDSYLLRLGDGADIVSDLDNAALQMDVEIDASVLGQFTSSYRDRISAWFDQAASIGTADYINTRLAGIENGTIERDWLGYLTPGIRRGSMGGGEDSVALGQGIGLGDVRLRRSGNNLLIEITKVDAATGVEALTGDAFTLTNWFTNPFERIEWLKFADGNEIRIGDFTSFVVGTNGADTLIGTEGNDFVYGGGGDDDLFLLAGDDIGSGGTGRDMVAGDAGSDIVVGGSEDDVLLGGAGDDLLSGDAGDDEVYGGEGADIVSGGRGDDLLVGGAGDDVFKYNRGDGRDTIIDELSNTWAVVWSRSSGNGTWASGYTLLANGEVTGPDGSLVRENFGSTENPDFRWVGLWDYDSVNQVLRRHVPPAEGAVQMRDVGTDTIEFGLDIRIQDIVLSREGDDLVMVIGREEMVTSGSADGLRFTAWFDGMTGPATSPIERLAFYSTGTLDMTTTTLGTGSDGNDILTGGTGIDWMTGGAGDDQLTGNNGNDILSGNDGSDTLIGGLGVDVLYGGSGDDWLRGGAGNSVLNSTEGDILSGGSGSDWASYLDSATGLTVSFVDPARSTGWARNDIFSSIENLEGSNFGDWLTGDAYDNIFAGRQGDDTLTGREGDDTYLWYAESGGHDGADTIREGGDGLDIVVDANGNLAPGYEQGWISRWAPREPEFGEPEYPTQPEVYDDVEYRRWAIWAVGSSPFQGPFQDPGAGPYVYYDNVEYTETDPEFYSTTPPAYLAQNWASGYTQGADGTVTTAGIDPTVDSGLDTLELGQGITFADLTFIKSGNNLIVRYGADAASQITIENHYLAGGKVETLQFHNGLSVNLGGIRFGNGSNNDDLIVRSDSAETVYGYLGDDTIWGAGGIDTIDGGGGDDVIEGGAGADTLIGGSHSLAADNPTGWGDTLSYFSSVGANVTVDFRQQGTGTAQIGGDAEGDIISGFENYFGSDANRDDFFGDDNDNRAFGNGGNDTLRGYGGSDVLVGGDGNDYLYGGDGDDNISGDLGNDYLQGDAGNDILAGGDGDDRLLGGSGDDHLIGGAGNDYQMSGGTGNDTIDGGDGVDTITGDAGNDTIIGGAGDDIIDGGADDDIYVLGAHDGADIITDTAGVNTIMLAPGITRNRVWLARSGNDLKISVIGGTTSAIFKDFYSGIGKLEKVQTEDGTLFVNSPQVQEMIRQMSGGFAASANILDMSGWPRIQHGVPAGAASLDGWRTNYEAEREWVRTTGPDGNEIVSLHAGQEDTGSGGGAISNNFAFDGSKGYEFTYYFKNDGVAVHNIYFGLNGSTVVNADDGVANTNPYFYSASAAAQNAAFEKDKWYKVVGYVLPEGSALQSDGLVGGVYDAETGAKVAETSTFAWNPDRTSNNAFTRFFVTEGQAGVYNTHFYRPDVRELGTGTAPPVMPSWFADRLGSYWEAGESAAPRAPLEPQRIEVVNYGANHVIEDFWPESAGGRGDNLLDDNGWPTDVDAPPPAATSIAGWQTSYSSEIAWVRTDGPYGQEVVSLHTGQLGTDDAAGGAISHDIAIDKSKAYEFSIYFKVDEESMHSVTFGLTGDVVNGDDGLANTNAYFSSGLQNPASGVEAGKWYKMVGYVLPDGSTLAPTGTYGGVYDVETGEKVRDIDHFSWDTAGTSNTARFRILTRDTTGTTGFYSHFVRPQMREVAASAMLTGTRELDILSDSLAILAPHIPGWRNWSSYALDGEARWIETTGPDGQPMAALETGQFDATAESGGQLSNDFPIDETKTYRYVQYVRKSDLDMHTLRAGIKGTADLLQNAVTGTVTNYGWVLALSDAQLESSLVEDKWYKVVGYILPEGSANVASGSLGGVYDVETGAKVAPTSIYRWNPGRTGDTAYAMFHSPQDADQYGWSAQWGMPEFTAIDGADLAADNADPFALTANSRNDESAVLIDASLGVSDADGDILSYELNPDGAPARGRIEIINAATGQIRYTPDVGATGADSFSVLVRDAADNITVVPIEVDISAATINRAPDAPDAGFAITIDENSAAGTLAGTLTTTDPDGDPASAFDYLFAGSLVSYVGGKYVTFSSDGRFRLERDTGIVRANEAVDDFETGQTRFEYDMYVRDRDGGHASRATWTTLTVELGDVNEVHALNAASIEVNYYSRALGPFIPMPDADGHAIDLRELMLADPEDANMAWAITSGAGPFVIDQDGGLRLMGAIAAGQSYALSISATDTLGRVQSATLTITVGNNDGGLIDITGGGSGDGSYDPEPDPYYRDWRQPGTYENLAPIVLDLDGDGVELVSIATSQTYFDMDGDGRRDLTGWAGADDGMLVYDANDDGIVNDGSEISFQQYVDGAYSDLEGLAYFDSDGDGVLGSGDEEFGRFYVWIDADQDGQTDAGELVSLADRGIVSISLSGSLTGQTPNGSDNTIYATGTYRSSDGGAGIFGDTFLVFDPARNPHDDDDEGVPLPGDDGETAEFAPARLSFDRKSSKFRAYSLNGELAVVYPTRNGAVDPRAGVVGAFSELQFSNGKYGYLGAIVLDLDGDGIETRKRKKSDARFDMNGDGIADDTGWTKSRDGFLVVDRNGNGRVDDGSELSFFLDAPQARSAMQGLASFDSNRDGIVSALDARFGELKIWADLDQDGVSDAGELKSLSEHGIVSISTRAVASDTRRDAGKNILLSTAVFNYANGSVRTLADVALAFKPSASRASRSANTNPLLRDYWRNGHPPRIEELTLQDILSDDFFRRFDNMNIDGEDPVEAWWRARHGDLPLELPEPAGIVPDDAEATASIESGLASVQAGSTLDAAQARMLAVMMQDMAAFGSGTAIEDQLRTRTQPYALTEFYS